MIAPIIGIGIGVSITITRFAGVTDRQWVSKIAIVTPLAMGAGISARAGVADVLIRGDGVLVIVGAGNLAGRTEVVGGDVQGAFAGFAVCRSPDQGVTVITVDAPLTFVTDGVMLTFLINNSN